MLVKLFEYPFLIRILNKIFTDNDKIKIIRLNKYLKHKRTKFTYDKRIKIVKKDQQKWYYNCLTNVIVNNVFYFPKSLKILKFDYEFHQPICFSDDCVTNSVWDSKLIENVRNKIPNSVTRLIFGEHFNQNIENFIPNSVTHLIFGESFDKNICGCIPNSVTHLEFGVYFNQNVEGCIPNSVIYLKFGWFFNQPILNNIPNRVSHLIFGDYFNQNVEGCIPNSVIYLKFGWFFNQPIENYIPNSVKYLKLGENFNQNINNLSGSIMKLTIKNKNYSRKIIKFPSSLRYLHCSKEFYEINKEIINDNIKVKIIKTI